MPYQPLFFKSGLIPVEARAWIWCRVCFVWTTKRFPDWDSVSIPSQSFTTSGILVSLFPRYILWHGSLSTNVGMKKLQSTVFGIFVWPRCKKQIHKTFVILRKWQLWLYIYCTEILNSCTAFPNLAFHSNIQLICASVAFFVNKMNLLGYFQFIWNNVTIEDEKIHRSYRMMLICFSANIALSTESTSFSIHKRRSCPAGPAATTSRHAMEHKFRKLWHVITGNFRTQLNKHSNTNTLWKQNSKFIKSAMLCVSTRFP